MALIDKYDIPEDQYDNGNIKGTKKAHQIKAHIRAMSDRELKAFFTDFYDTDGDYNYSMPVFRQFVKDCSDPGVYINIAGLMLDLAGAAYDRYVLDEDDYLRLQEAC